MQRAVQVEVVCLHLRYCLDILAAPASAWCPPPPRPASSHTSVSAHPPARGDSVVTEHHVSNLHILLLKRKVVTMDCTASPHLDSGHIDLEQEAEPLALLQPTCKRTYFYPKHWLWWQTHPEILLHQQLPEHEQKPRLGLLLWFLHVDLGGDSAQV